MASIRHIVSPLTKDVAYRAQARVRGRPFESATFPNRKEAEAWAASIEAAFRDGRHVSHTATKRASFNALAKDYIETAFAEFDEVQRSARTLQLDWWSKQFAGKRTAGGGADGELGTCRGEMRIRLGERGSRQLDVGSCNAALDSVFPPGARNSEHLLHNPCALIFREPVPFCRIDNALKARAIVGFIEVQDMIRLFDVRVQIKCRCQAPPSRRQEELVIP